MKPLAERMRPDTFEQMVGQQHLVGPGSILRNLGKSGHLPSMIFWGPPGSGKTTLAHILSKSLNRVVYSLSAVNSGVREVREVFEKIHKSGLFSGSTPILFIDEIHRFSKSQQDSLLSEVEKGSVILTGATTENPSFEVISPLLSRCQVYLLKPIGVSDLELLLDRAIQNDPYLKSKNIELVEKKALIDFSMGDARKLLNNLEVVINNLDNPQIDPAAVLKINDEIVEKSLLQKTIKYDKNGEEHYNIISAFIKSLRGSDPNAAVYWLARMIETGEKPEFIARRMIILASEDIGLANPTALMLAASCFDAVHKVGWPESRIILSQCAIYLAVSPKSNSAYEAINKAQETVKKTGPLSVPVHLRNAVTGLMKDLDYGKNYKYAHNYERNFSPQEYMPEDLKSSVFYFPGNNQREDEIKEKIKNLWNNYYDYK